MCISTRNNETTEVTIKTGTIIIVFRDQLHGKHDEVIVCGRKKDERSMGFNSGIYKSTREYLKL